MNVSRNSVLMHVFSLDVTSIKYWIGLGESTIVSPGQYTPVDVADLLSAINTQLPVNEDDIEEYTAPQSTYYTSTHFILIHGQAYFEDLPNFKQSLQSYFSSGN